MSASLVGSEMCIRDSLRAQKADEHEALSQRRIWELTMEAGARVLLEAGQRALLDVGVDAPLPEGGDGEPASNDGPEEAELAEAAGQAAPVESKEE
eukprot:9383789-Alexandrium_andersonii.AAC.1